MIPRLAASTALLLLPFFLGGCGGAEADQAAAAAGDRAAPSAKATRVEIAVIRPTTASLSVSVPGEVTGARDANLASAMGGYVEAVWADIGDEVSAGQLIAQVDGAIYSAQYTQAEAQMELAEAELERVRQLGDLASASQLHVVETQAKVARAGRDMAGAQLNRAMVTAPFAGIIASVSVEAGEVAGPGTPVARLVQLDPVTVTLSVPDRDVVALSEGMTAHVTTNAVPGVMEGVVAHIAPAADLKTRAFPVEVDVPNPDGALLPGMIARVTVSTSSTENALVIPQDWLVTRTADQGVFVVEDNRATWRTLTLGAILRDQVVIAGGLEAGESVVITGHRELVDGDPLIISREGVCCESGRATFAATGG